MQMPEASKLKAGPRFPIFMELVAENLVKRFGGFTALDGVSFAIRGAGCYGYLGPNGAGKTTTMKIFTNLLRPTSGHAYIDGVEVHRDPVRALRRVGALIEDPEPYGYLTVREFIEYAAKIRRAPKPDLAGLRDRLDLPDLDKRCSALSKGQKRRVFIAALLAQNPEILVLDEPASGLDPKESQILREVFRELKRDHLILLSSHILYEVNQVCDYIYFIHRGRIIEQGSVEEVSRKFSSKALIVEFYERPRLDEFGFRYEFAGERKIIVYFDGSDAQRRQILDRLYPLGVRSFGDAELGLEEAYRQVVA